MNSTSEWIPLEEAREIIKQQGYEELYKDAHDDKIIRAGTWLKYWLDRGKTPIIVDASDIDPLEHNTFSLGV